MIIAAAIIGILAVMFVLVGVEGLKDIALRLKKENERLKRQVEQMENQLELGKKKTTVFR